MYIKNNRIDEMIWNEGFFNNLHIPEINLKNWTTIFERLKDIGKNVIVEYETVEGVDDDFIIGKAEQVYKSCVYMHYFDVDGIRNDDL